jgi:hypothetical protein
MMKLLIPIAAVAALMLGGCDKPAKESAKDIDKAREGAAVSIQDARQDANKTEDRADRKVADAQQDYAETTEAAQDKLSVVESEAMRKKAEAEYEVASTAATGHHDVAKQKCDVLAGAAKDACLSGADAALATEQAMAVASRDQALVLAESHE